jgi:hypothetical protein
MAEPYRAYTPLATGTVTFLFTDIEGSTALCGAGRRADVASARCARRARAQRGRVPAQALDRAAGYLMAFGAITAFARRCTEGSSWHVRVSLAQTGKWLRQLGRIEHGLSCDETSFDDVQDLLEEHDSGFGRLTAIRHSAQLSETAARWARPSMPLGAHLAAWPK